MEIVERIQSFRNFLGNVNLGNIIGNKEEFHFLSYRDANSYLLDSEVEAEVAAWTLRILEEGGCPAALTSALTNAVLLRIKESDLREVRRTNQTADGDNQQELEPIKLFTKVTNCIGDVLEEWQQASDEDLSGFAAQMEAISVCAIKNGRRKMEDRHVVIQDLNHLFGIKDEPRTSFYAVFDGHAGTDAAVYSTVHLHCNIANHPSYLHDLPTAIREGFTKTDLDFIAKSAREELKSGSTALACLLRGRQLHLAWLGDSQAILVRDGKPVYKMLPHKPDREDEKRRIENAGGCVIFFGTWRVNGTLAVSRAIGDTDYKPFVCSDADIETIALDGSEDFVVLACDGLWDVLSADDVVTLVYRYLTQEPDDVNGVSAHLVQAAKERGSSDNITVIVVFLRDVSEWPIEKVANATAETAKKTLDYVDVLSLNENREYDSSPFAAHHSDSHTNGAPINVEFAGNAFDDATRSPSWEEAGLQRPASASTLDSSAPEFIPSGDKAASNPFASGVGVAEFDSSNMFSQPMASNDNPFFQASSDLLQGGGDVAGDRYGFDFSAGNQMIDVGHNSGAQWLSDVHSQEVPFGSEVDGHPPLSMSDLMQPMRPIDLGQEHGLLDHEALIKSTLSPDAEPFVMGDRTSPFIASSGGGSERSASTPLSDAGDDFMMSSLQPTAPPAELTPRVDHPEVEFGSVGTTSEFILPEPQNQVSSALSSPLEEQRPLSIPASPSHENRPSPFPASPLQEERPSSFPASPVDEKRPSPFLVSPVEEQRPSSFPVSAVDEQRPSFFPVSPVEEQRPSSFPASPVDEQRPSSFPASPVEEQRPSSFPASPVEERRPSSFPASPVEEQRPSSFPASLVEEHRPSPFPASPVEEQRPSPFPASPVEEQRPSSFPASPVEEQRPSSFPASPLEEQRPTSFPSSPLEEECRFSPVQHEDFIANDVQQGKIEARNESPFDAFLGQRSEAAEARPDTDHHHQFEDNALFSFGNQTEPERVGPTVLSPSTHGESTVQFTESLVKDDLHTVYTAGESPMTTTAVDFLSDHQDQANLAPSQYEISAAFDLVADHEKREDVLAHEPEVTPQQDFSVVHTGNPADVSADNSGTGVMLGSILDSAPVAEDVEDADSEDDDEWRFHATGAAETKSAEQTIQAEAVQPAAVDLLLNPTEGVDLIPKAAPTEVPVVPLPVAAAVDVPAKPVAAKRSDPLKSAAATTKPGAAAAKTKSAPSAASRSAPANKTTAGAKPLASSAAARPKVASATTSKPLAKTSEIPAKKPASAPLARKAGEPLKVTGSAAATQPKAKPTVAATATAAAKPLTKPSARSTSAPTAAKKPLTTAAKAPAASTTTRRPVTATTTSSDKKTTDGTAAPARRPAPITKPASTGTTKTDGTVKVDIKQTKETTNKQISGITKRTVTATTTATKTSITNGAGSRSSPAAPKPAPARSTVTTSTTTKTTMNGGTNGTNGHTTKTTTTATSRSIPPKTTKTVTSSATATTRTPPTKSSTLAKSPAKTEASPASKLNRTSTLKTASPANGRKAPAAKTPTRSGSTAKVAVTKRNTKAAAATNEEAGNEKGSLDAVAKESVAPSVEDILRADGNKNDECSSEAINLLRTADEHFDTNGSDYHHLSSNGAYTIANAQSEEDSFLA